MNEIKKLKILTDMKRIYSILTALALVVLYGCTSDELVGDTSVNQAKGSGTISFDGGNSVITRSTAYGSAAASKLGSTFVVYGTKHVNAEDKTATNDAVVFNNFQVKWTSSSAGSDESNTSDWGYIGLQAYDNTPSNQGIKYWDYSAANGHTFYAFSSPNISFPKQATDLVSVTKVTADETSLYNKGYSVAIKSNATLANLYFSDRVPVAKADYEKTVSFTFRNIGTLVRFGFYETIPGYKVKIDRFYIDDDAEAAVTSFAEMKNAKNDGYFYASLQNVKRSSDQTLNVTYYDNSNPSVENRAKLSNPTGGYDYTLKLGSGSDLINTELGTTASSPTWVNSEYTSVFPFEDNTNPLLLKLDFTMYAEDGSPDVIHVRGARAVVPAQYMKWKSNFAYTYIFKISDKTNGTTGNVDANDDPTDPEGLKPITFDAITVDVTEELQQTISSVSTNSITTYAEGAIVNEYTASKPIYVVVSNSASGAVIAPSAIGDAAGEAQVYKLSKSATESDVVGQLMGSPMGITMTPETATLGTSISLADGSTPAISNVKFTPSAANTYYAYVYTTEKYVAPTYLNQSAGTYDSGKTYYMKTANNVYYAVTVANAAAFNEHKAQLYIIDSIAPGTPGKYDVKVIKVQ
jgi:hypothetical protein